MTFKERLRVIIDEGRMTRGDLVWWFGRPYATIRYWLTDAEPDFEPGGPRGGLAKKRLKNLEWAIAHGVGFPISPELSLHQRPAYIKKVRDAIDAGVSETDTAGGRV